MRLHVRKFEGPADRTLLVVHGGPDWDHSYLVEPLDRLAGEYRLLFPDLRGCGRSPVAEPLTPDAMVDDLAELVGSASPPRWSPRPRAPRRSSLRRPDTWRTSTSPRAGWRRSGAS
ncbi:alpha/beta hydrolase [Nonomuraea sp. NPDC003804]|uniref:alpha/beta fold hydrolase n=1 Tax=Nonomuraea sp. NPDC003804 TaxID=3154547 RepID=UPI00339EB3DC